MRRFRFTVVALALSLLLAGVGNVQAQPTGANNAASVQKPRLRKMLLNMVDADRKARKKLISRMGAANQSTSQAVKRIKSLDAAHLARLKKIFTTYGWPGRALVGRDGSHAAWLLVQHADQNRTFQKYALKLLKAAVERGQASGRNLAYLTDQLRVAAGKAQIYGTQIKTVGRGANVHQAPYPIKNKARVNARRKRVGLMPLQKHMKLIRGASNGTSRKGQNNHE